MDPRNSIVPAVQKITTNLRVPGGIPGAGIAMFGARGGNFGLIDKPIDRLTGEIVRGAMTILGKDTKDFSRYLNGEAVVRNIGGTSYNISTPEGQRGYKKAMEAGKKTSVPQERGRIETERENINKVRQKGTALSPMAGANQMLENLEVTTQRYGKFQSNDLPGSNYSPEVEKALSKIYDSETLHRFDGDANDIKLSEDLFIDRSGVEGEGSFYADDLNYDDLNSIDTMMGEGSPFLVRNGGISTTSQVNPQNKNGTRARYDQEFLNSGKNSQAGLRAADASKGLLYASGQYWRENPNAGQDGEKDFLKIDKDEYKAIKNSDMGAQDFLSSKLEQTKQTFKPDLTGQSDSVRDAVGLTADPYRFTTEGPVDERSARYGESIVGNIDEVEAELPYTTTPPKVITQKYFDDLDAGKLTGRNPLFR